MHEAARVRLSLVAESPRESCQRASELKRKRKTFTTKARRREGKNLRAEYFVSLCLISHDMFSTNDRKALCLTSFCYIYRL